MILAALVLAGHLNWAAIERERPSRWWCQVVCEERLRTTEHPRAL